MKSIITNNKYFFLPFVVTWMLLGFVLIIFPKTDIHLFLNNYHNPFFDVLFIYITHLGDGLLPVVLGVVLLFFSFRKGLTLGLGATVAGLLAQFGKRVLFPHNLRPKALLQDSYELYFVPGVEVHSFFSFPSGHTTTAFCVLFILASFVKNKAAKLGFFGLALIVGYSRIYLSQHFLVDVYFGALIGVISAIISIYIFQSINARWINKSLLTVFKK
jgi:membrane-associated phospholipid phosphatase